MQADIRPALKHFGISDFATAAVQDIRHLIDLDADIELDEKIVSALKANNKIGRVHYLLNGLFGIDVDKIAFTSEDEAVLTAQALVEYVVKNGCVIEDIDMAIMAVQTRVKKFTEKPENRFFFVKAEPTATSGVTAVKEIGGVQQQVQVTEAGKFKKGEKERLADQLYLDFLKNDPEPNNNQKFIKVLMDQLGMSKAGATTYNYNLKKKHNPSNVTAKPKRV